VWGVESVQKENLEGTSRNIVNGDRKAPVANCTITRNRQGREKSIPAGKKRLPKAGKLLEGSRWMPKGETRLQSSIVLIRGEVDNKKAP